VIEVSSSGHSADGDLGSGGCDQRPEFRGIEEWADAKMREMGTGGLENGDRTRWNGRNFEGWRKERKREGLSQLHYHRHGDMESGVALVRTCERKRGIPYV
jgi:hypothetical protein